MSLKHLKEYVYSLSEKVPDYYVDFGLRVWLACYGQFLAGPVIWYLKNHPEATAGDVSRFIWEISEEQEEALRIYEQLDEDDEDGIPVEDRCGLCGLWSEAEIGECPKCRGTMAMAVNGLQKGYRCRDCGHSSIKVAQTKCFWDHGNYPRSYYSQAHSCPYAEAWLLEEDEDEFE